MGAYKRRRSISRARPFKRRRLYKKARRSKARAVRRFNARKSTLIDTRRAFGFGQTRIVQCRWVATENMTVGTLQVATQTYTPIRLNNAYDPWSGLSGTFNVTVAGFKLYAQMYKSYAVLGAKLITTFRPLTTLPQDKPFKVGVRKLATGVNSMPALYNQWQQHCTDPDSKVKNLIASNKAPSYARVVTTYSPRKEFGIKDPKDNLIMLGSYVNSGPPNQITAVPFLQCIDGDLSAACYWQIEHLLLQRILFFDRNDIMALKSEDAMIQSG